MYKVFDADSLMFWYIFAKFSSCRSLLYWSFVVIFFMSNESKKNQQQIKDPIVQPFLVGCVKLV